MSCHGMLPDTSIIKAISITTGHSKRWIFTRSDLNRIFASATIMDQSPCDSNAKFILGSLIKQCILFEISLQFYSPPPPPFTLYGYIQCWNSKKNSRYTRPILLVGCQRVPRLLSMIVGLFTGRLSFAISLWLPVRVRIRFKILLITFKGNKGSSS